MLRLAHNITIIRDHRGSNCSSYDALILFPESHIYRNNWSQMGEGDEILSRILTGLARVSANFRNRNVAT